MANPKAGQVILKARIELDAPASTDTVAGVSCLTHLGMVAAKLLANSDRWVDDSLSRDLIDLAITGPASDSVPSR